MAKFSHSASKWNCSRIKFGQVNLAGLIQDFFCLHVLLWRHILWVEWTVIADVSILLAGLLLIAVQSVILLKLIQEGLLHGYLICFLTSLRFFSIYLEVNFRTKRSEILIETFLPSERQIRIIDVEWLVIDLVSTILKEGYCASFLEPRMNRVHACRLLGRHRRHLAEYSLSRIPSLH